jgi:hypothetical protein
MRDKSLRIYLDDHLAVLVAEVELLRRCRRSNRGTPLGDCLLQLENEVRAQQAVVRDLIHRIGGRPSLGGTLKQGAAWAAEKAGRLKRNDTWISYSPLSRVVELETLAAAAQERVALWDSLDALAGRDPRLDGITYSFFRDQSQAHRESLSLRRRYAAITAFM